MWRCMLIMETVRIEVETLYILFTVISYFSSVQCELQLNLPAKPHYWKCRLLTMFHTTSLYKWSWNAQQYETNKMPLEISILTKC
jgi:hypothetical protein